MRALAEAVDSMRGDDLTPWEVMYLDVLAFGSLRERELRDERAALARELSTLAAWASSVREGSLIASMGVLGAEVQPWAGVIGAEGQLTGDGRLIEFGALSWADFPLPLRYAPADLGGHVGAVLVGRIDAVRRGADGLIYARGVLDLGSDPGREVARLIGGGMLSGVSLDLDSTIQALADLVGGATHVISEGRVRAATLVSIPAFDVARISLVDGTDPLLDLDMEPGYYEGEPPALVDFDGALHHDPDDCGCGELATAGVHTFTIPTERTST